MGRWWGMTIHDRVWHKWYDDGVPPNADFDDLTIDLR